MQKVTIADPNNSFSVLLAGALRTEYLVEVYGEGACLIEHLRRFRPDVLVLDLMLPDECGFNILKVVRRESLLAAAVLNSRFFSGHVLGHLKLYPVAFATLKPCSVEAVADAVRELCETMETGNCWSDRHCVASSLLLALNMPTNKKGFTYCRESILLMAEEPGKQVTKEIYPVLAKEHGTTSTAVEKAIRAAIDSAWEKRREELWRQYFPPAPDGLVAKPTNTLFLSRLSEVVCQNHRTASGQER